MSPNSLIIVAPITLPTPGIVVIGELRLNCYAERIFCFVGGNIFKVGDNKRINLVGFVKKDTGRIAPRVCLNGIYDVNDEMIFHEEKVQSEPIVSCCLHADFKYEFMAQGGNDLSLSVMSIILAYRLTLICFCLLNLLNEKKIIMSKEVTV